MNDTGGSIYPGSAPSSPRTAPASGYSFASIHEVHADRIEETKGDDWSVKSLLSVIMGVIAIVLVAAGLVMPYIGWIALVVAPIGLAMAILARMRYRQAGYRKTSGMMVIGIVLNGISLLLTVIIMIFTSF